MSFRRAMIAVFLRICWAMGLVLMILVIILIMFVKVII